MPPMLFPTCGRRPQASLEEPHHAVMAVYSKRRQLGRRETDSIPAISSWTVTARFRQEAAPAQRRPTGKLRAETRSNGALVLEDFTAGLPLTF